MRRLVSRAAPALRARCCECSQLVPSRRYPLQMRKSRIHALRRKGERGERAETSDAYASRTAARKGKTGHTLPARNIQSTAVGQRKSISRKKVSAE